MDIQDYTQFLNNNTVDLLRNLKLKQSVFSSFDARQPRSRGADDYCQLVRLNHEPLSLSMQPENLRALTRH